MWARKGGKDMRVIVADDQPEVRSALRLLLEEKPGIDVIAEVRNSKELLRQVKLESPELVLLDWELPGAKPEELISSLHSLSPVLSVVALSSRPQMRQAALDAGARDFVCKSEPPERLMATLDKCREEGSKEIQ
jgi:DNA-binding NarL/FixJ family response regulator